MRGVRRAAGVALGLSHQGLPLDGGRPLSVVRSERSRAVEPALRRPGRVAAVRPWHVPAYNPQLLMNDALGRPLRNLRLSVTDRCNLRCEYCMPEDDYTWLPRED